MMRIDAAGSPGDGGRSDAGLGVSDAAARDASTAPRDAGPPVDTGLCTAGVRMDCATSCGTTGSATCTGGRFGMCVAPAERCNGADDDCDMRTDEGFACAASSSGSCPTSGGRTGTRSCSALCA